MLDFDLNDRRIWLYGEISNPNKYSTEETISDTEFHQLLRKMKAGPITLHINSPGGICDMGLAIYNALKNHSGKVTTINDSIVASIASILFCAGSERLVAKESHTMLHSPHTVSHGNSRDLKKTIEVLEKYESTMLQIYSAAMPKLSNSQLQEILAEETWLNADDAIRLGLATGILGESSAETTKRLAASKTNSPTAKELADSQSRLQRVATQTQTPLQREQQRLKIERRQLAAKIERRQRQAAIEQKQIAAKKLISTFSKRS